MADVVNVSVVADADDVVAAAPDVVVTSSIVGTVTVFVVVTSISVIIGLPQVMSSGDVVIDIVVAAVGIARIVVVAVIA